MAAHVHTSPTGAMPPQHGPPPPGHQLANGSILGQPKTLREALAAANEGAWLQIGSVQELQGDLDGAVASYEQAIRHNNWSVPAMQAISNIYRAKDQFGHAIDYLRTILKIDATNGEVWGSLGHCYLMMDNLQEAYSAYQQALYHLQNPKEPKLWYGIGILYDRYGSLDHAEEAFSQVMSMAPDFEKANEIYFRLGIIYKQQGKYSNSLECFKYIVSDPPRPLTEEDIWFQIGHVHEQQKDYDSAKAAYKRVLDRDPKHAKVLQQLGWLHHQQSTSFQSQEQAIDYLEKSVASDQNDAQSWYLLGRCYMAQQKYPKAYEAYQQAVYRDGRNPTFWCSIGVLYYQINQYRDALDAYSRAIRLNPNISEVWYDLGTLYESCNNQTADALDAYQRAADLDPTNVHIKARLQLLQNGQPTSGMPNQNSAPLPQDVHPQAYQPAAVNGPPGPQWGAPAPSQGQQSQPPPSLDYGRRLADIQQHPLPVQQLTPYDQRDGVRPPPPPGGQRPASPPPSSRQYPEPPLYAPGGRANVTPRRGMSPSPKSQNAVPALPSGPPATTSANAWIPPPPPVSARDPQAPRIANPNYGSGPSSIPLPPPPPPLPEGMTLEQIFAKVGHPIPPPPPLRSPPPPEVRPIVEQRPSSAESGYQAYAPHSTGPSGIAAGAPAPAAALAAAEEAARNRAEDRTPNAPKRLRDYDDALKEYNEEKRLRLDDSVPRPPSVTDRHASSNNSPTAERSEPFADHQKLLALDRERQRQAITNSENYHPSEAAHHPPPVGPIPRPPSSSQLPAINSATPTSAGSSGPSAPLQLPSLGNNSESSKAEQPATDDREGSAIPRPPTSSARAEPSIPRPPSGASVSAMRVEEPAARKMEVDENYDDDEPGEVAGKDKAGERSSPRQAGEAAAAMA